MDSKVVLMILVGSIGAQITGYGTAMLALVNFVWILVKDQALFSWWVLLVTFIAFVVCCVVAMFGYYRIYHY